ncbi:MAG: septum formation initiator family protein [Bacteroidales bacterium]|nr:septum formation initiator family protein [Bacteroidales bacterium]
MLTWLKRYVSLSLIVILGFVAYVLFFNENSIMRNMEYASQIRELEKEIAVYEDTLMHYQQLNEMLDGNPAEIERIVRERYHMQRLSEDVYIFE